jgi:hypothetical protein
MKSKNSGFTLQIKTFKQNELFILPGIQNSDYNFIVDWGDGVVEKYNTGINFKHIYKRKKTYKIEIKGKFDRIYFNNTNSKLLVRKVLNWGGDDFEGFTDMSNSFYGCQNLNYLASGGIKERKDNHIKNYDFAFAFCSKLKKIPEDLFSKTKEAESFIATFSRIGIKKIPGKLFFNIPNMKIIDHMFSYCTKLKSIPVELFNKNLNIKSHMYVFSNSYFSKKRSKLFYLISKLFNKN